MRKIISFVRNFFSLDKKRRYYSIKLLGDLWVGDYRQTWSELDWFYDDDFNAYLEMFGERDGMNTHRKLALWELLRLTRYVEGDTAECGVYRGASSYLICAANLLNESISREHHLFDSFEGLSEPKESDGDHWQTGALSIGETEVARNLRQFHDMLVFHKGWIPERFSSVENHCFSFVHVDVDLEQPTRDSIEFFYDRLTPGAVLLCDDYGCTTCPGATASIDKFLQNKPEKMISLPGGGGFFIKNVRIGGIGRAMQFDRI